MDLSSAVSTLNDLIETNRDSEQGFRTAAAAVKNPHTRALFERFARQRAEMAVELEAEVRKLGGKPETGGSMAGAAHRGWMNIKSAIVGKDDTGIISEAERGEDVAKAAFEKALKENLPAGARRLIEDQAMIVRLAHDDVRALEKSHSR
jgi:uncharacterized protein (TIGR02284 family)